MCTASTLWNGENMAGSVKKLFGMVAIMAFVSIAWVFGHAGYGVAAEAGLSHDGDTAQSPPADIQAATLQTSNHVSGPATEQEREQAKQQARERAKDDAERKASERVSHWEGVRVPVFTDSVTGFAIRGFDAVAFFTDGVAKRGQSRFEVYWQDAYWVFANPGNRDAFKQNPEIYAPRFGGYGAVAMGDNALAETSPELFAVEDGNLFLFAGVRQQAAFATDPDYFLERAEIAWREKRGLPPQIEETPQSTSGSEAQATNGGHEKPFVPKL
jgi:hypothetical protein